MSETISTGAVKKYDAVFEGGGVKGIGLVGALSVVEASGYVPHNIAGTSAGAIVAALLAAGYKAAELKQILMELDFNRFVDPTKLNRVPIAGAVLSELTALGLYKGEFFLSWIRELLAKKGVVKFGDLRMRDCEDVSRYGYKLNVVASDISRGEMLTLPYAIRDYGEDPDRLEVARAVRMSMSIPLYFVPCELYRDGVRSHVVDGGLLSNFPVDCFDSDDTKAPPRWPTFGFHLAAPNDSGPTRFKTDNVLQTIDAIFETMMRAHDARYIEQHKFVRTIMIDTLDVGTTEFGLLQAQKDALFASGEAGAKKFLDAWSFEEYVTTYRKPGLRPSRPRHPGLTEATPTRLR